jgi:hypothetical protein
MGYRSRWPALFISCCGRWPLAKIPLLIAQLGDAGSVIIFRGDCLNLGLRIV